MIEAQSLPSELAGLPTLLEERRDAYRLAAARHLRDVQALAGALAAVLDANVGTFGDLVAINAAWDRADQSAREALMSFGAAFESQGTA